MKSLGTCKVLEIFDFRVNRGIHKLFLLISRCKKNSWNFS